jgi:hypothetical protein
VAANFFLNMIVLGCGLWFFGHDGKMVTYTGMALVCASTQWLMLRSWRS